MKYRIHNVAKRPVSILCNTGESRHLPPDYSAEFIEAEVTNNSVVKKLVDRGLIRCVEVPEKKVAAKKEAPKKAVPKASTTKARSKVT